MHEVIATLLGNGTKIQNTAIFGIRLPRILLGIFVAAGLAISGGVLQTMTRNELADPGIIGINAGGATAAVLFIQFQTNAYFSELGSFSIYLLPLMAISGALAAAFCIYFLSCCIVLICQFHVWPQQHRFGTDRCLIQCC